MARAAWYRAEACLSPKLGIRKEARCLASKPRAETGLRGTGHRSQLVALLMLRRFLRSLYSR